MMTRGLAYRWAVAVAFLNSAALGGSAQSQQRSVISPDSDGVVFAIGVEDKIRNDFKSFGWEGVETFGCTVGIDCVAGTFPLRLCAPWARQDWDRTAVARLEIDFNLGEDIPNAILRVARFGMETDLVSIDGGPAITATGIGEDQWSANEYRLGHLQAGPHKIVLSVSDERVGSGRHALDAIMLLSR
jgi:hypothetical protein